MMAVPAWGLNVGLGGSWITRYPSAAGRVSEVPGKRGGQPPPDLDAREPATLGVG